MKKKYIGGLITLLVIAAVFIGCCTTGPVPIPDDCQDSIIYNKLKNPAAAGTLIQLANLKALKENVYRKNEAITAITVIRSTLDKEPITFVEFLGGLDPIIEKYASDWGAELLMVSTVFDTIRIDIPIGACDKKLIISLCDKMLKQLNAIPPPDTSTGA